MGLMKILLGFVIFASLSTQAEVEKNVESMIEEVNTLRETLVNGVTDTPDLNTFKAVCKPVGMNLKKKAEALNVKIRQASDRYRNPENKANLVETQALQTFRKDKDRASFWLETDGQKHYFRRINVIKQCLACHGEENRRPEFVRSQFPGDKAFGFQPGDLRGLYHVILPPKAPGGS